MKIDNDLYFLSIKEGSGKVSIGNHSTDNTSMIKTNPNNQILETQNVPITSVLVNIFENQGYSISNPEIKKKTVDIIYKVKNLPKDEEKLILWSNLKTCFGIKQTTSTKTVEKWAWELKDSTLLAKAINKDSTPDFGNWRTNSYFLFGDDRWESHKNTISKATKDLSQKMDIFIENKIESKELYNFLIQLPPPISKENIINQLESYGILMKVELIEKNIIVLE